MEENYWRRCGSCKKEIKFNAVYQACSVSGCSKSVFCSVDCWDQHVPIMNHKSSWAEERRAPAKSNASPSQEAPRKVIMVSTQPGSRPQASSPMEQEILIVASKLKQYIKDKHDLSTSATVMDVLSRKVRELADQAAAEARTQGRKTLLDRDFK